MRPLDVTRPVALAGLGLLSLLAACSRAPRSTPAADDGRIAPAGTEAAARLAASPRHAEWVTIGAGTADSVRAWVVYPERSTRAPVVVVVHEIFGYTDWVASVADQLAAQGFIAVAPDFLTGKVAPGAADSTKRRINSQLDPATVVRQVAAAGAYGTRLPAAQAKWGVVGFCWGGTVSFNTAVANPPGLGAAVVYYGSSPATARLGTVAVPVLGLYGADDARVNATVPPADSAMKALGKSFTFSMYPGAGHGFLRQQDGREGANLRAAQQAWPATIAFFRQHLGT
ncbi:MAG TPA: dienelactone hydrolase family protein [Gemmatimonadaceae bacterium]|nr:dienelactone hydrolase family protein [Gemmatimonadaceae bacterium]